MRKLLIIGLLGLFANITLSAQFKEYSKLNELFSASKYNECLDLSLKYNAKENKELVPVLYCSKSYFELFKTAAEKDKLNNLKNSLKYAGKIKSIDKKETAVDRYSEFLEELHQSSLDYGNAVFNTVDKDKTKPVYEYLVKIYKDTTAQYLTFYPLEAKNKTAGVGVNAKVEKKNQTDLNGLKQGFWSKVYPSGILAYEVTFKDDKPVGELKRYHENGKLSALLIYDQNGEWAVAKHYDENSKPIAEGKYHNKLRSGLWIYSMDGVKVAEENFIEGKKNGISKTFYKSGQISEEKNWEQDAENGVWRQYYPNGKIKLETRIEKGKRNAVYYTYYQNGRFETKGRYKEDSMDGEWVYYDENGAELEKVKYVMGKTEQQKDLDKKENEFFKKIDANKSRLIDPADYITNPTEYLQKNGLR